MIGIDQYAKERIPSLHCAVNDAEEVSRCLETAGFDVVTLTNEAATCAGILDELGFNLNQRVTDEDDPVLIYWSGHGLADLSTNAGSDKGWATYLLPFDADMDRPLISALPVQKMWALLNRLTTRRLLVMLDTCFSGVFVEHGRGVVIGGRGSAGLPDDFLRVEGHGRVVISACGANEVAREDVRHGHGKFTRAVLAVLERGVETGDRRIRVTELTAAIRDEAHRTTGGEQTPSLYVSGKGTEWSIPLPPPAAYQPPLPSWAFVGTSGGVGKTTLAMLTAELLAESGNTVLYLDADLAQYGGTSAWCERAKAELGSARTFADHVAAYSRAGSGTRGRRFSDRLMDVTPAYLRRHGCGRILLLPATRPSDKTFAFHLVAEIKDRRSNAVCRKILDGAFDRGVQQGATCIVIDCGAQFDPLAVNSLSAAHHPFVVAAARAGAKGKREIILSNCAQTIEEFDQTRVETVVNRVPSRDALIENWGDLGFGRDFHHLPFDRKLFQDWEEGRPNFELGYDELTHAWHKILVASDRNCCDGLHRDLIPSEWDRFSKWALWLVNNPKWAKSEHHALSRMIRRSWRVAAFWTAVFATSLTSIVLHLLAQMPADDASFLPQWLAIALVVGAIPVLLKNALRRLLLRRRRKVIGEVRKHSVSTHALKKWFSVPLDNGPWWQVWKSSRREAIKWLHGRVIAARNSAPPVGDSLKVFG
ncbi:caspase family protein [Streptomyces rimosus]|uniref:caspase family protein n=1 Tax=Streptomyces rimosus TaxID=1927 RepID=UPI0004C76A87|nr:caspase family protein [Streptomyces rimosus]